MSKFMLAPCLVTGNRERSHLVRNRDALRYLLKSAMATDTGNEWPSQGDERRPIGLMPPHREWISHVFRSVVLEREGALCWRKKPSACLGRRKPAGLQMSLKVSYKTERPGTSERQGHMTYECRPLLAFPLPLGSYSPSQRCWQPWWPCQADSWHSSSSTGIPASLVPGCLSAYSSPHQGRGHCKIKVAPV